MVVYAHPHEARRRLAEIGVPVEALVHALEAGQLARLSCTDNDAPFIHGTEAWRFTLRTLREELLKTGIWRKADPGNYSLVISDKRRLNIVVASGDPMVRKSPGDPRTKSIKGLYTEAATVRNRYEEDLFPETLSEQLRNAATVLAYPTYMFLVYITDDETRSELSLPDEIEDGQIVSWKERIFIPDSVDDPGADRKPVDDEPEIDIPVRRRAA